MLLVRPDKRLLLVFLLAGLSTPSCGGEAGNCLLVGADGTRQLTGAVYLCTEEVENCRELPLPELKLKPTEVFGVTAFSNTSGLFVGWRWRGTVAEKAGAVLRCAVDATECRELSGHGLGLKSGDSFGWSLGGNDEKVFVGAREREGVGSFFICKADGTGCLERRPGDAGIPIEAQAVIGASVHVSGQHLFVGAIGVGGGGTGLGPGAVYRCNLDGKRCQPIPLPTDLQATERFGYAITHTQKHLFVGAVGRDGMRGALYRCELSGEGCARLSIDAYGILTDEAFGGALLGTPSKLYVSAVKRDAVRGSVFVCATDGTGCKEKRYGSSEPNSYFGSALALVTGSGDCRAR